MDLNEAIDRLFWHGFCVVGPASDGSYEVHEHEPDRRWGTFSEEDLKKFAAKREGRNHEEPENSKR
jgi:hypothetical protein